jgi:hypothetical protein
MSAPDFTDLNNLMVTAKNLFQEPIYNWTWRTNPYISMFTRREFEPMDGLVPEVVTTTSELPTSYPDALSNLTLSDGTGSDACDIDATVIQPGYISRSYQLEVDAWQTPVICLTDLQFDWKAEQTIANLQQNLGQFTTVRISDLYRMWNIRMVNTKVSTAVAGAMDFDSNSDTDFTGVDLPTEYLDWSHLDYLYDITMQLGAEQSAVGYSEGMPLLALCVGPGIKRALFQNSDKVRSTVNWGDAFQNFTARGINTSINGFIPNLDLYPVRYAANGTTKIYPTRNVATTKGMKSEPNPAYRTVANGGSAVYEVAYVLCRDIYEVRPRPIGTTQFGQASFNAVNYVGDINWINNKDNEKNILGNKGFYRMDLQMAARPIRPELGFAILTLAMDTGSET